jgi:acyl carrier protein
VDKDQILARLRGFVEENFLYMRPDFELKNDQSLMGNGIVDSMGVMEMIQFLEEEFGVEVSDEEITEDNLGSLDAVTGFVVKRGSGEGRQTV